MGWLFSLVGMKHPYKGLWEGEGAAGSLHGMAESDVLCKDDVREHRGVSEGHVCFKIPNSCLGEGLHEASEKQ